MKKYVLSLLLLLSGFITFGQKDQRLLLKPGNGKLQVIYQKTSDSKYSKYYNQLSKGKKKKKLLYSIINEINNRIKFPKNVKITFMDSKNDDSLTEEEGEPTNSANAHYSPNTQEVTFYYQMIDDVIETVFNNDYAKDLSDDDKTKYAIHFILLHELGHCLFHQTKMETLGNSEDIADEFAIQFILTSKNIDHRFKSAFYGILYWFHTTNDGILKKLYMDRYYELCSKEEMKSANYILPSSYSDIHSPNPVRYYRLLSKFIGFLTNEKNDDLMNIAQIFVRKDENEQDFEKSEQSVTLPELVNCKDSKVIKNKKEMMSVPLLNMTLPLEEARGAYQTYKTDLAMFYGVFDKYLRTRPPLFKSRSENYRFFKLSIGIAQTAQNSKEFYNSTLQSISNEIGASVYLESKLNLTNHFSMGLKIAPTIITPKNTNSAMSIFLPVMLSSELYLGQRRLRPFIGLSAGGIYSGGWKLNYRNLQTDVTEPFKIPAKITLGMSPRVGLVFGKIRADFEYNWMAGKVQTLAAPSDADVKDGVYFGTGNLEVIPLNRNHFTLRFGIDIGGGKKYKQWRE